MLSGNLSSTAQAFLNMTTDAEVSPAILQTSDNSIRNWGVFTILLIGLAIFCLRRPTPARLYSIINAPRNKPKENKAEEVTELTQLIDRTLPGNQRHPLPVKGVFHSELQTQIDLMTDGGDPTAAIEILTDKEFNLDGFDLSDFDLDPTKNTTSKRYGS